ncbi:MAG: inositol monophosphatase [Acidobacteria bacterium]|nr:inositol monophosphatase [Acidobacteriota bacterium]
MLQNTGSMEIGRALEVAVRAAREGGRVAKARLGDPGYLKWKGHRDVVSEASLQVQEAIVSTILAVFPGSGILAEEGPEDAPLPVDAAHLWIVDPICGSLNFVQGIPYFGISIALRSEGNIRVGVVYDPCCNELFEATTETPATLNGRKIVVQQISEGIEAWSSAIVGTDWPRSGERRERTRLIVGLMADQIGECNLMGSPALGFCNVAAGRLHAYWHLDLKIWDIAAASLILQRAGGVLTDAEGMTWLYSDGGYIASNAVIHGWTLNCIQAVSTLSKHAAGGSEPRLP